MKFREYDIDDIIVIGPLKKFKFLTELKKLHEEYDVIDLQYSTDKWDRDTGHSALALVRSKK